MSVCVRVVPAEEEREEELNRSNDSMPALHVCRDECDAECSVTDTFSADMKKY